MGVKWSSVVTRRAVLVSMEHVRRLRFALLSLRTSHLLLGNCFVLLAALLTGSKDATSSERGADGARELCDSRSS
jgi:hypothetical protein